MTEPNQQLVEAGLWLVWGTRGEYSGRYEWPVAIYDSEAAAQEAAAELKRLSRDLYAIYRSQEDELEAADDWGGKTLLTSTEEGREFAKLHGDDLAPGSYDFGDMEFTCSPVPFRAAIQATDGECQRLRSALEEARGLLCCSVPSVDSTMRPLYDQDRLQKVLDKIDGVLKGQSR
jgi:hypothetical protein